MRDYINKNKNILLVCIVSITCIALVTLIGISYAAGDNNFTIFTRDELSEKIDKSNLFLEIYPIGSIYQSTDSTSPAELYGGTWTQIWADYERYETGSQVIYNSINGTEPVPLTRILDQPQYLFLTEVASQTNPPTEHHMEYRLTSQITTAGCKVTLFLNNINTGAQTSGSDTSLRSVISTNYFKESDIILEPIVNYYGTNGINFKYQVDTIETNHSQYWWYIWNVTIHAYITSDNIIYKWQRTA